MKLSDAIKAKSDQLNAIDLIGGPIVIKITSVKIAEGDQPVAISYANDNNRPWKPSKSMLRVLIRFWGDDESLFIGRSVKIWCDPTIKWAGSAVGGVAILEMTDMDNADRFMLTTSRGQHKAVKIEKLVIKAEKSPKEIKAEQTAKANVFASQAKTELEEFTTLTQCKEWEAKNQVSLDAMKNYKDADKVLTDAVNAATKRLTKGGE